MNILIIGGGGYIGNALSKCLHADTLDIGWFGGEKPTYTTDYRKLDRTFYKQYSHIILLAGHSSVSMCKNNFYGAWQNNVTNFSNLLGLLDDTQTLIYASSGSVYGVGGVSRNENSNLLPALDVYDLTKQMIEKLAIGARCKTVGLRLGTLSGYATFARKDLLLNAFTVSAKENKSITVFNGDNHRSVLSIDDCTTAIKTIIEKYDTINLQHNIYNLASFSGSILSFAEVSKNILQVPLYISEEVTNNFSFELDVNKFKNDFTFDFRDTAESVLEKLIKHYEEIMWSDRKQQIDYV